MALLVGGGGLSDNIKGRVFALCAANTDSIPSIQCGPPEPGIISVYHWVYPPNKRQKINQYN